MDTEDIVMIEFSGLSMEDYQELKTLVKATFGHKYQWIKFIELNEVKV